MQGCKVARFCCKISPEAESVKDIYRRRAAVIGYRCGVIFMLLAGKETNACVDYALTMAEYTPQNQCRLFGPLLKLQNEWVRNRMPVATVNENVLKIKDSILCRDRLRVCPYGCGTVT